MPSQFFGLNIAYSGLLASNAALNTTANNIANAQTDGYSRQQVVQQAANALRVFQAYGCAGAGVETLAIERVRDEFYDGKFWNNNKMLGEYQTKEYYTKQIENYFTDDVTTPGFKTIFDQMTKGLQEIIKNAGSPTSKAQFISFAQSLTEYFNNLSGNMKKLQTDVNQEIKIKVDEINSISTQIATLNKQINTIEMNGGKANELRDQRTKLVDQLSKIVDVQVKETPVKDPAYPDRVTGATRFTIDIAGGQSLVDGTDFNELLCVARGSNEKVNQSDVDGLYEIYWENGQNFNIYNGSLGGELRGLMEMRDGNNNEGFNGTISGVGKDASGNNTVTVDVTKDFLKNLNQSNLSDTGGKIVLGNQVFYYDSWSYTKSKDAAGNETYSYTFTLSSDPALNPKTPTTDRIGKEATIGDNVDYQGIPYYMKQMNEWVRTFSQKVNDILNSGYDVNNDKGSNLFTGNMPTSDKQYGFDDPTKRYDKELAAGGSITVSSSDESYYLLTADNFNVLSAMLKDSNLLATKKDPTSGNDDYSILTDIKNMFTDKKSMSFRGSSANEFLTSMLADVALNASWAKTFSTNYSNIAESINTQRLSISGVDEDEEAVNLVKFQNGYNLASKMIQVLTEIYDKLILDTGV